MSAAHVRRMADQGQWAVVTGASSGIGRAFAEQLGRAGVRLVLVARRQDELAQLAASLPVETRVLALDLALPGAVQQLADATADLDSGLLVAAAGFGTSGALLDSDLSAELDMLAVNCGAVLALAHVFARRFAQQRRGAIVLLSSLVAFQGVPRAANYAATKAYVQTFAEGLARELQPLGVRVIAVAPGPVRSGFGARAGMQITMAQSPDSVARRTLAKLGRPGTVRPGLLSAGLELSLAPLPRILRTRIMAAIMAGMTKHQHAHTGRAANQPA